jgi:WD40 repeat protein
MSQKSEHNIGYSAPRDDDTASDMTKYEQNQNTIKIGHITTGSGAFLIPTINIPAATKTTSLTKHNLKSPKIHADEMDEIDNEQKYMLTKYSSAKHKNAITQIILSPVSVHHLFSSSVDHNIVLWDMKTKNPIRVFHGHTSAVTCFDLYKDTSGEHANIYTDMYIFSGSKDSEIRVWSIQSGKCLHVLHHVFGRPILEQDPSNTEPTIFHNGPHTYLQQTWVTSIAINIVDKCLFVGGYDGHILLIKFEVKSGMIYLHEPIRNHFTEKHKRQITCMNFDGRELYTGSSDGTLRVWQAKTGVCKQNIDIKRGPIIDINSYLVNDKENATFIFLTVANDVIFYKKEEEDITDDIEQNDPLNGINDQESIPIDDIIYHNLKLNQITQKKFKPIVLNFI